MEYRIERDSLGEVEVPVDYYWGAQTQRSFENFPIGREKMPNELLMAMGLIKYAAAKANYELGELDKKRATLIQRAAKEIMKGRLDDFPLVVWQTGSGTQTNMNVNEVITNRGNEMVGEKILHPNDHVNMSQSSNDTFPTAMHIGGLRLIMEELMPALDYMIETLAKLEEENKHVYKVGRTHLQDAVPISFSQEISAWRVLVENDKAMILSSAEGLKELAIGGTAIGTGINAPEGFYKIIVDHISAYTGYDFRPAKNKFSQISGKSAITNCHGSLKTLACDLLKIANDIRWLASGPRTGLRELILPSNEPGSSIMPGKVNPTQAEALAMVCVQVMGNDVSVGIGSSQGYFQLNVYMPMIIYNFIQSVYLLADGINSFTERCLAGMKANEEVMGSYIDNSIMVATALNKVIGYDKAAEVVKYANKNNLSIKKSCLDLAILTEEEFDKAVDIGKLVGE